jgi:hypothetical protein
MHSTVAPATIATTQSNCDRPIVRTPQRKANYNDKDRPRRKDLKAEAFQKYGCSCTADVKKYLKVLKIKLDLRLTAAWKAIVRELHNEIVAAKAIVNALEPPAIQVAKSGGNDRVGVPPTRPQLFKKGDRVNIIDCPPNLYFLSPFVVSSIDKGMAQLDYVATHFALERLELAA